MIRVCRSVLTLCIFIHLFRKYRALIKNLVRLTFVVWILWDIATIICAITLYVKGEVYESLEFWFLSFPDRLIWPFHTIVLLRLKAVSIYMKNQNKTEAIIKSELRTLQKIKIVYFSTYVLWTIVETSTRFASSVSFTDSK